MLRRSHVDSRPGSERGAQRRPQRRARPAQHHAPRRKRDVAIWMTLGLVVAIALTLTTHRTTDPTPNNTGAPHSTHALASLTVPTPSLTTSSRAPHSSPTPHALTTKAAKRAATSAKAPKPPALMTTPLGKGTNTTKASVQADDATQLTLPLAPGTTTSTTSPVVPTTTAPVAQLTTVSYSARLSFPGDVSTEYLFSTSGGAINATAQWTGDVDLDLTLSCRGAARTVTGPLTATIFLQALSGTCHITLGEPTGAVGSASYTLNVSYVTASIGSTSP